VHHVPVLPAVLQGWINEPCPASWQWNTQSVLCEYVLHGEQSAYSCCPLGLTTQGPLTESCGCRDDLTETPFRMAYTMETEYTDYDEEATTTFNFNLALVQPWLTQVWGSCHAK
jgi:hypothetical protein